VITPASSALRVPWRPVLALLRVLSLVGLGWVALTAHHWQAARLRGTQQGLAAAEANSSKLRAEATWSALRQSLLEASLAKERRTLQERNALVAAAEDLGVNFGHQPLSGPPVPRIAALVLATKVDIEPGLVLLNVGLDDAVEVGFRFSVYRGNTFLGKVTVERVLNDRAGCRILFLVEGASVEVGDQATTHLQ